MEIKERVNPENYKNLEITFNIIKYPQLKSVASKVARVLTHCQKTLEPDEIELQALLQDTKVQTADFMGFIDSKLLAETNYTAGDIITSQIPQPIYINTLYRNMSRDELFQSAFNTMGLMKHYITREIGVIRHPAQPKKQHISINAEEYIDEYQKLFTSMDSIYTYFAPTNEDNIDKTL